MNREKLHCCLVQSDIHPLRVEDNLNRYRLILESIENDPDIIVFPEMFAYSFTEDIAQTAVENEKICLEFLYQISQKYGADVVASLAVVEKGNLFNRLVWIREDKIIAKYDKRHLFFGHEKQFCTCGKTKVTANKSGWNFLPLICYDIRFPNWCRNHYKDGAILYDCLLLISNFPTSRMKVLKSLLTARAIENQAYVIAVNRIGEDAAGHKHCGKSMVINPLGEIIAEAPSNENCLLSVHIERDVLEKLRKSFPVYLDWDENND